MFDVDAAVAAQREALGAPFEFTTGGEKFVLPRSEEWPIDVSSDMAAGKLLEAIVVLLAISDEDAPERFLATDPKLGHVKAIFEAQAKFEGVGDLKNSVRPQRRVSIPT